MDGEEALAARLGRAAAAALREEAALAPKPGLVDPLHRGAHLDMDYPLLLAAIDAIEPHLARCASIALQAGEGGDRDLLEALRPVGLDAERAMLAATGGVNTHRGAIFCLGLLSAAAALAIAEAQRGGPVRSAGAGLSAAACARAAAICAGLVEADLGPPGSRPGPGTGTAGARLYGTLGARGARGEAEAGYPILLMRTLPPLREGRRGGAAAPTSARIDALLGTMAELEDSCLLSRGGSAGLALARGLAAGVLAAGGAGSAAGRAALARMDEELCARNLSPGGSADMLAAGLFLESLESGAAP
jgi:triphosphoribosyl-dephospho-CoA synthase